MISKQRKTRELVGLTFSEFQSDPTKWMTRAREFRDAAVLLVESKSGSLSSPYYYNAALSLELSLKAILVAQKRKYQAIHRLKDLSDAAGVQIERDHVKTLELLSECLMWLGRYPIPKSENQWNNFHDVLFPKHKVTVHKGKIRRVIRNEKTFPTLKNYLAIWNLFQAEYSSLNQLGNSYKMLSS